MPKLRTRHLAIALVCLASIGCAAPIDEVSICILPASDRIVVEARASCASDHKRATLSCTISRDGSELEVTKHGREGKDPNDACAPDLTARCESEVLPPGTYRVTFEGETQTIEIPNEESSCDTTGGS